jgi:hypothetical protein
MGFWSRVFRRIKSRLVSTAAVPLPILVHWHPREALPPGPLEDGIVEIEMADAVLHALAGVVQPDGTLGELAEDKLEWARRLSYRHLKREGCLADYGIPEIPEYDREDPVPNP